MMIQGFRRGAMGVLTRIAHLTLLVVVVMGWLAPGAIALTSVQISDLDYHECPANLAEGAVTSMGIQEAHCFLVTGKATNPTSKYVIDADVFGRIYDANGNPVLQNRTRIGSIPEIPPGESDFQIRIMVAANQPTPLQLKQFKASGFTAKVRPFYYAEDDQLNNY